MAGRHESFIKISDEMGIETTYYSSLYEGLPDEFERKVAKKLNEKEELKRKSLQELKEYLDTENHRALFDDHLLLAILRLSKYNMKNAEAMLKKFQVKRQQIIRMLVDVEAGKIEDMIDDMFFGVLPYRDKNGSVIVFTREGGVNLERYSAHDVGVIGLVFALFLLKYPLSTVTGFSCFADSAGVSRYVTPIVTNLTKFLFIILAFPIRISRVEIFNESFLHKMFSTMVSPFIDSRLISMASWHGPRFHELQTFYDPNIVPEEFGGNMGPLSNAHYKQTFLDFVQQLKIENISFDNNPTVEERTQQSPDIWWI